MKQTQTKMFDFSDVGLDFCVGSKNLFPDRFKKMLAQGYNTQTVSSVVVTGNQVVLTYGVNHGYVAGRVLKINASNLTGEYVIDSVIGNSVKLIIDDAPALIHGGFTTLVAPLGWELEYEKENIQIYKMKHIDESIIYVRMCFQNTSGNERNSIVVGVGKSADIIKGIITDTNCIDDLGICETVALANSNIRWDFTKSISREYDNYSYSQGYSAFGKAVVVGSPYHLILGYHLEATGKNSAISGILPFNSLYPTLNYPILMAQNNGSSSNLGGNAQLERTVAYVGKNAVFFHNSDIYLLQRNFSKKSFLPESIDGFNTTTCLPLPVFTATERQYIGHCHNGVYQACYEDTNCPVIGHQSSPTMTVDVDFTSNLFTHYLRDDGNNTSTTWLVMAIEEIKNAS
ncbi:hypothetical protein [Acinetobacter guillouiae]|uniref:hypothetical protein n=1 Tax=Acinetobacter guillouiae TaxID=106649 RepID=UPI0028EFB66A|nr:hypothetical protein [Acinetobacter guillouiae]